MRKLTARKVEKAGIEYDCDYNEDSDIISTNLVKITHNSFKLASSCATDKQMESFDFYCLERYINALLRQAPDSLSVVWRRGYPSGVELDEDTLDKINIFIDRFGSDSRAELVETILLEEYGYVLPSIKGKGWGFIEVEIEEIVPGNTIYHKINKSLYNDKPFDMFSCLCLRGVDCFPEFTLVDGYHRYAAALHNGDSHMRVLWCWG